MKKILIELKGDSIADAKKYNSAERFIKMLNETKKEVARLTMTTKEKIPYLEIDIQENAFEKEMEEAGINVIHVEAEKKELNLCELLRNCIGQEFYMPHYGIVKLNYMDGDGNVIFYNGQSQISITKEGLSGGYSCGEICVFPSKEQRDWSLFQPPWVPQKGERVWAKNPGGDWKGCYFVEMSSDAIHKYRCSQDRISEKVPGMFIDCVPFNQIPW